MERETEVIHYKEAHRAFILKKQCMQKREIVRTSHIKSAS